MQLDELKECWLYSCSWWKENKTLDLDMSETCLHEKHTRTDWYELLIWESFKIFKEKEWKRTNSSFYSLLKLFHDWILKTLGICIKVQTLVYYQGRINDRSCQKLVTHFLFINVWAQGRRNEILWKFIMQKYSMTHFIVILNVEINM